MSADRIEALERQLKRLQRVTAVLAIGFVWLVAWRLVPGPPVSEAREFRMVDAGRRVRGAMSILDDGRPVLRLNDINGKARAMLYLDRERGGGLRFIDTDGEHRVEMFLPRSGDPEVRLNNAKGALRTRLMLANPGQPALQALDDEGSEIATFP
jgi:hypothetical protein